MNPHTEILGIAGPAGRIDIALDRPREGPVRGIALIAHPHPLYGGTRDNKVVQTLARTLLALGYICWRPNFRGVGDSEGVHDHGQGETDDLLAVIAAARAAAPGGADLPVVLAGFSFGTLVLSRVAQRLSAAGTPARRLIFIGTAVIRPGMADVPADTLVLHGELDDTVPLSAVLDWARPQGLPVVVIPGADHFFHQKLTGIKDWLMRALQPTLGLILAAALAIGGSLPAPSAAQSREAREGARERPAAAKAREPARSSKAARPLATVDPQPATQGLAPREAPPIAARSWLLIDVTTGQLLAASQPDLKVDPASLTKLMTAYLAFNAVKDKKLTLDARPPVSPAAFKAVGSRMFIDPASPATVDQLLHGLIIQSGNDAAVVLAEAIAGSEPAFADLMNREAQRLGLANTAYANASGLPATQHYSTARDLAALAVRVIDDHPDFFKLYAQRDYTYNNIRQPNRNRLLFIDPSVDGMKTGHTESAGYCLVATSRREQPGLDQPRRLLSVVLGAASESARAIESQKLLNYGYSGFDLVRLYGKEQAVANYTVFKGASAEVKAGFTEAILTTVPRGQSARVKGEIERIQPLIAPLEKGQRIGTLRVKLDDQLLSEHPLVAIEAVPQAGLLGRAWDTLRLWLK
jgi:D-alanyl-D-alanine carboxypeptidase (penicillin-binding protein 5/6)